jgi:hypothetical protein
MASQHYRAYEVENVCEQVTVTGHPGRAFSESTWGAQESAAAQCLKPFKRTKRELCWENLHEVHVNTSELLENRFPDVKIIGAFSIFDVKSLPEDPVQRQSAGKPLLDTLCAHYGPHGVIAGDSLKAEYPLFVNSVKADDRLRKLSTRDDDSSSG